MRRLDLVLLNGNLPVTEHLETQLAMNNIKTANVSDSEMMGLLIAQNIRGNHDMPDAVEMAYPHFRGAFSCVAMQDDVMVAFRDSRGIRPLAIGKSSEGYVVASETSGLDIVDATYEREVEPGEMVIITTDGYSSRQIREPQPKLDMFEYVYFARPDSQLYGQYVGTVRRRFGEQLALEHPPQRENGENTVVIPVPETSVPAAEAYGHALGLRVQSDGIVKNRYIGRTFMQPTHQSRTDHLRRKHSIIPDAVQGRDVVFIDDSIVRLNTIPKLVEQAQGLGAKSVEVLIASPPVRFPDFYGIDTPQQSELPAAYLTVEEMAKQINVKRLGFLSLAGMVRATGLSPDVFNLSCFNGDYPIGIGARKKEITRPVSMEYAE